MQMRETQELLRDYAETGSETAFRELVGRYMDLVYSTARRLVSGDAHLAEDVAQTVFLHLSRNARKLARDSMLGGWLHRDACFVAGKVLRANRRRQAREREAVLMNDLPDHTQANLQEVAPLLDEAINLLGREDRLAVLLRFFEQRDFRAIGAALGTGEDAARMRVNRALDKLQLLLKRRGVALSTAALATALAGQAVSAAPAGLAGSVAGTVLAQSAASSALSATLLKTVLMTKLKTGIICAVIAGGVVTSLVLQHQASASQRAAEEAVRKKAEQLQQLAAENQRLAQLAQENRGAADRADLAKLRAEAAPLSQQASNLPELRRQGRRLQAANSQSRTPLQTTEESMAKGSYSKNWVMAFMIYSMEHNGTYPKDFEQAAQFFPDEGKSETNLTTAQFEIVYQGRYDKIPKPAETIVLREKEPWLRPDGTWAKWYGFADGHAQLQSDPDGNFDDFEQKHLAKTPKSQ
jgi:RNA polymerase sigma factor (sigma-70 family)